MTGYKSTRNAIRYKPDPSTAAQVMFEVESSGPWTPHVAALVIDESALHGVQLVALLDPRFSEGAEVRVKLGGLDPIRGTIAWKRASSDKVVLIGVKFTE